MGSNFVFCEGAELEQADGGFSPRRDILSLKMSKEEDHELSISVVTQVETTDSKIKTLILELVCNVLQLYRLLKCENR